MVTPQLRKSGQKPVASASQEYWHQTRRIEFQGFVEAANFAVAGAHAIYDDHPLQRLHSDINTASHHAIVDFNGVAEIKGRLELGLVNNIGLK